MYKRVQGWNYSGDGVNFAGVFKHVCEGIELELGAEKQEYADGLKKSWNVKKEGNIFVWF